MFGGHGLYEDLQPVGLSLAALGLLPVVLRPAVRFDWHPLRSTLAYCALMALLVSWSTNVMLHDRAAVLAAPPAGAEAMTQRLVAFMSVGHAVGLLMVPLLWAESRCLTRNRDACASLMASFGHLYTRCSCARSMAWASVVIGCVFSPLSSFAWLVLFDNLQSSSWKHGFVHSYVQLVLCIVCGILSCQLHCLRTFANKLSAALAQELAQPYPSARRLGAVRHAWVLLRDVTRGIVSTPLTVIVMLLFVLLMTVLGAFLCLQCFVQRKYSTGLLMIALGVMLLLLLLVVCDSAHRAVDAVSRNFLHPLDTFAGNLIGEAAMDELHALRDVVAANPVAVSAGGFWSLDRGTMSSILAACVSYLIVLIQFRQAYDASVGALQNQSAAA